jgi:CBS domain-containing protein
VWEIIKIKDIMTRDVITVDKDTSILDTAKLMEEKNISSVIVAEGGMPVGIVTERDLVRKVIIKDLDAKSPVSTIMSSPLVTVSKEENISSAAELMMKKKIRRLPVVDKGKLMGIVTETNISTTSPKAISEFSQTIDKIDKILKDL